MKLWLDDIRPMPVSFTVHAKTAADAIQILRTGLVTEISFDHDLGPETAGNGYQVACFIEAAAYLLKSEFKMPIWQVHSANPVGRQNIVNAMNNAERYSEG